MSSYSDFADSASRILEHKGDALAQGKARSGELWGSTIGTLGNQIPPQVQAVIKANAEKRKAAAIQSIIQQSGGDLGKALPQIMGIDATIGTHLADEHAKVQKSIAEVQKLQTDAQKAQLDFSDRLWSQVSDEGSYAHAALVDQALGGQPLDHYDPAWVKQKQYSLLSQKDQIELARPKVHNLAPGGKLVDETSGQTIAENPYQLTPDQQADNARQDAAVKALADERTAVNARLSAGETRAEAAQQEQARHNKAMEARPVGGSGSVGSLSDVKETIQGMKEGTIPPQLPGRASKEYTAMMAEAHRQGYDLAGAVTDWTATQKHIATLNGAQQTRMAQAIDNAAHSLDVIDTLADQWNGGKFPLLNKAILASAKNGALGAQAQQIATNLDAQIADVTSELGNVYMGGNSPTDHALGLAAKNLSADWTRDQLKAATKLARQNLIIRQNSIKNAGVAGASASNPYAPQPQSPATTPAPAPATTPTRGAVSGRVGPYTYVVK